MIAPSSRCPARRGAPGARRASRSREARQRDVVDGPGSIREPRRPSRSPVEDCGPVAHDERDVVGSRPGRGDHGQRDVAEVDPLAVGELAGLRTAAVGRRPDRPGSGSRAARRGPPRRPNDRRRRGSARSPGSRRRAPPPARPPGRAPGPVGSPGSTSTNDAAADEVGVDGLPGDAARRGHLDAGRVERRPTRRGRSRACPVASRSRTSSNAVTCSSCWSVAAVGGHSWRRPSAIASSASPGRSQVCSTTSSPCEARASRRRGAPRRRTGHRTGAASTAASPSATIETSRSVRSRQVELRGQRLEMDLHRRPARCGPRGWSPRTRRRCRRAGRRPPRRPRGSRRCTWRSPGSAARRRRARRGRLLGEMTERATRLGWASAGSTRPPGKTWTSGANAIDGGRRPSSTSGPDRPGRSRTRVAAGRGSTGVELGRARRAQLDRRRLERDGSRRGAVHGVAASSSARSASGVVTGSRQTNPRQT